MIFRSAYYNDYNAIINIERLTFPQSFNLVVFIVLAVLAHIEVAVENEQVIGYLVWGYERDDIVHIYRVGVSPQLQNKGVGAQLLHQYIPSRASVSVRQDNTQAIRFYEKQGFHSQKTLVKKNKTLVYMTRGM